MCERNPTSPTPASDDESVGPDESPTPPYLARPIDASAMKAFAHPLRMAMYDYLNDHGSATATILAGHTGESTGQTSYHLRQLERHGFVAEDEGRGTGRERWWKAVGFQVRGTELAKDTGTRPSVEAMLHHQTARRAEALLEWFGRSESEPERWQLSSTNNRTTVPMTAAETVALRDELMEVLQAHTDRAKARHGDDVVVADDEVRRVRLYLDLFPLARD